MTLSIGIIGFGGLGRLSHELLAQSNECRVSAVLVRQPIEAIEGLLVVHTFADFLAVQHDVVIECAGQAAVHAYGVAVLTTGADLVPASVGALGDGSLLCRMLEAAKSGGAQVRIPAGAMVGIDGIAAARRVGVDDVIYRGTSAPGTLKDLKRSGPIVVRTLVFEGNAREAVAAFPRNANLTGTIALAGVGFERTRVELYVDPEVSVNLHEIEVTGAFGTFQAKVGAKRISELAPSSRIVAGSLVQAALGSNFSLLTKDAGAFA